MEQSNLEDQESTNFETVKMEVDQENETEEYFTKHYYVSTGKVF